VPLGDIVPWLPNFLACEMLGANAARDTAIILTAIAPLLITRIPF
jgi:hypothetical protein